MGNHSSSSTNEESDWRRDNSLEGASELSQSVIVLPTFSVYKRNSHRNGTLSQYHHTHRLSKSLSTEHLMSCSVKRIPVWKNSQKRHKAAQWLAMEKEKRDTEDREQLFSAAVRGDEEILLRLLICGVNINTTDENHLTALHYAAMHARPQIIEMLVDHGAKVNAYDMKGGFTPLHWVVINSQPGMSDDQRVEECLIALVRGGCNINAKDFNQATPLHFAARMDNKLVVDSLMRLGADPNEMDVLGRTCTAVAKSEGTKILIIKLADLRARAYYHVLEVPFV